MTPQRMYEIAAEMRNRAWDRQSDVFGDWEPVGEPVGNAEWWYLQDRAEAAAFESVYSDVAAGWL